VSSFFVVDVNSSCRDASSCRPFVFEVRNGSYALVWAAVSILGPRNEASRLLCSIS
jgi:hypothetical protein